MKQKGYTLIELMIVVAIVGILASLAVPAYQDYLVRARITEGLNLASSAQTTVAENAISGADDLSQGWVQPSATKNVQSVKITPANGVITVTYSVLARHVILTLTPLANSNAIAAGTFPTEPITWTCAVTEVTNDRYVPTNCRI